MTWENLTNHDPHIIMFMLYGGKEYNIFETYTIKVDAEESEEKDSDGYNKKDVLSYFLPSSRKYNEKNDYSEVTYVRDLEGATQKQNYWDKYC